MFVFLMISISILLFFGLTIAYKNTKQVMINSVAIKPLTDSPSINILHLSDIHLENLSVTPQELIAHVKDQPIDLIALTGDFLDRKRSIPKLIPYLDAIQELNPTFGTYAVFGNHDYVLKGKNFQALKSTLENHGIHTLQNENRSINANGQKINIIGIDDFSTKKSDLSESYKGITDGYNLVLTHDPNIVLTMKDYHFDYLLSGHFHGGQIHWPKPYHLIKMGKLVRLNMVKGLHYHDGKPFYISEGLGQTGVNIRVGSRPEITFHDITIGKSLKKYKSEAV